MQGKPNLTLELDSHTADAGIETRIEAYLDIIESFRKVNRRNDIQHSTTQFTPAGIVHRNGRSYMRTSEGNLVPLTDRRVRMLIPSMGKFASPLLAKAFAGSGIRADVLPPADESVLKLGRENSSCKECLPLQTTIGSVLNYLKNDRQDGELIVYFMPTAPGPCRFGQYNVFIKRVIKQYEIKDIAVFSPDSANCYGGLGGHDIVSAFRAVIIGDIFDEMWATILTAAVDGASALETLLRNYEKIRGCIDGKWKTIAKNLQECAEELSCIPLIRPYGEIPKISLVGEIYVRHDPISLQHLVERMAKRGFIVRTAQVSEWLKYLDWMIKNKILGKRSLSFWIHHFIKERTDKQIRKLLAPSGLFHTGDMCIDTIVNAGGKYISPELQGETILTIGSAFHDILNPACGVISLGPFGCMPNRVAEAILKEKFGTREKRSHLNGRTIPALPLDGDRKFPFLAIETDGNPFPQIIEARLEAFCLQAERVHQEMLDAVTQQDSQLKN
jgi:predicted nucleotide-binding protein (sugar kinase/HSP70/actin superfamily)